MLNYDKAIEATNASMHSQNSAMNEQEKFADSLQARINRLQNAWYGLSAAAGESFIGDGIVVATSLMQGLTESTTGAVSGIGLLAPAFGLLGTIVAGFSPKMRDSVTTLAQNTVEAYKSAEGMNVYGRATKAAGVVTTAFGTALKGLAASIGIGLVFAAIGFAVEKLTSAMAANIEEQQKFDSMMKKSADSLTVNKDNVDALLKQYKDLDTALKNDSMTKDEKIEKEGELLRVQNQINDVFPALIDHIDSSGQAYIKNAEGIDKTIEATKRLADQQSKTLAANAIEEFEKISESLNGNWYDSVNNFFKGSIESQLKQAKQVLEYLQKNNPDEGAMAKAELEILKLEMQAANSADQIKSKMFEITQAINSVGDVEIDVSAVKEVEKFVQGLDMSNLDSEGLAKFAKQLADIEVLMSQAIANKDKKLYEDAVNQLMSLAASTNTTEESLKTFKGKYDDMIKSVEDGGGAIQGTGEEMDEMGNAANEAAEAMESFKTAHEALAGVSEAHVKKVEDLVFQYEMLTLQLQGYTDAELQNLQKKEQLTSAEAAVVKALNQRSGIMDRLREIYPDLLDKDAKSISLSDEKKAAIERENKANKLLIEGYKLASEGKLNAEQKATLATTSGTVARIQQIRNEIEAMKLLQEQMYNTNMTAQEFANAAMNGELKPTGHSFGLPESMFVQDIQKKSVEAAELDKLLASNVNIIEQFTTQVNNSSKATKDGTKASRESKKAMEESKYVVDQYKNSLDKLNLALTKNKDLMEQQRTGSNARRTYLAKEIELEKQKLAVMTSQNAALQKQISSGKVVQTGIVKTGNTSYDAAAVPQGQKMGGAWQGRVTSTFGSRADNHRGVDIASGRGTPIYSPVNGTVIKSGAATATNNGKGMHWSYGNLVVVQDDNGVKHLMAHMDKSMAKLGDRITAGTQVGTVGTTGNSSGNHLHYEQNSSGGKVLNPNAMVNALRNGTIVSAGGSSTSVNNNASNDAANMAQALDQARGQSIQQQQDIIAQQALIRQLEAEMINQVLMRYENRQTSVNNKLENVQNNLKKLNEASDAYRNELNKEGLALLDKKKINQEEITYLDNVIKKGKLSDDALAQLEVKLQQLKNENAQIDFSISENYLAKIESLNKLLEQTTDKYTKLRETQDSTISYQTVQMKELDSTSKEYLDSLDKITESMRKKQDANRKELKDITTMINNGKYYGESLTNAKKRVQELTTEIKQLQIDIQDGDFEILVGIKNTGDDRVADISYEISRLEELRKGYKEGSADYKKYSEDLIAQQEAMQKAHEKTRDELKAELQQRDITKDRIREIKRLLEQEHIAYLQAGNAIKDYTKQLEDSNKAASDEIANKIISALKAAYQELRDEQMKALDDIAKKEADAHNKRLKDLNDERDAFRKNIDERLRLIDRTEAERSYDMEIGDLEKERSKVQDRMYTIRNDKSYSATKERKQLQDKLDEIDKNIAEKRHQRDIELQKQGLSDLGEMKDKEIEDKIEKENEYYDALVKQLDDQKRYWEKYYTDLLNDERKFAKIREDIAAGHFDKVQQELQQHIDDLTATMPQLEDTMNNTMQAVGTAIRQNVIDELGAAMKAMQDFMNMQQQMNDFVDDIGKEIGNIGGGDWGTGGTSKGNLSDADMKVLFGKFLYDNVAPALTGKQQTSARETGKQLGQQGYKDGSKVDSNLNFNSALSGLTAAEMQSFMQYLQSQKGTNGGAYDKHIDKILGGNQNMSNMVNKFGVKSPMTYGDMQVMMAKYMREYLISDSTPQTLKDEVKTQANTMAEQGRASGSGVSSSVTYQAVLDSLDGSQRSQFKEFLKNQSGMIRNQNLAIKARSYAASLDTGGMLNFSGQGVDGKGGKFIIAHNGEVVNNPIETGQLLQTVDSSRVMLQHLKGLVQPITGMMSNMQSGSFGQQVVEETNMHFHGDFVNINKKMMEDTMGAAFDEVRATKGAFNRYR